MEQMLGSLKNVLEDEKRIYEALLELAGRKKDVLVKGDVAALEVITQEEMGRISKLKSLEKARQAAQNALNLEENSFEGLLSSVGEKLRTEFTQLRLQLSQVIQKLADMTEINRKLIYSQLEYTSFCMEVLTRKVHMGETYGNSGHISEDNSARFTLVDQSV